MGADRCIYTFIMTRDPNTLEAKTRQVAAGCSCGSLRRASRAVTQLYDGVLQPSGLKATQFTLLVAAARLKAAPISLMAEALVMDRTTLTRNLKPLVKDGLLAVEPGEDRRSRWIRLTPQGPQGAGRGLAALGPSPGACNRRPGPGALATAHRRPRRRGHAHSGPLEFFWRYRCICT